MWWQVRIWRRLLQVQNSLRCVVLCLLSSCRRVALSHVLNHVSLKYISSTEKVYSSLYFVFIDADVSSVVNESVAPQTHANEHAPTPIDDVLMDPIPSVRLHDTTQSLAKFSPRSCRPLDQPRCRRASRVHYVKRVSGRSFGLAHRFTNRIWWGLWRGLQDFLAELTRNAAEFLNLSFVICSVESVLGASLP